MISDRKKSIALINYEQPTKGHDMIKNKSENNIKVNDEFNETSQQEA